MASLGDLAYVWAELATSPRLLARTANPHDVDESHTNSWKLSHERTSVSAHAAAPSLVRAVFPAYAEKTNR